MRSYLIERKLRIVAQNWQRVRLWTAVWTGVWALFGFFVLVGAVDLAFELPVAARVWLWLAGLAGALAGVIYLVATRGRRRLGDQEAALLVEGNHPELQDRLVSAVQLGGEGKAEEGGVTGLLVKRLVQETEERLKKLDVRPVVSRRSMQRRGIAVVGSIVAIWVLMAVYPGVFGIEALRVLAPWRTVGPAGQMHIAVAPGNAAVRSGRDQRVEARIRGPAVEEASIQFHGGDGTWREIPMEPAGEDSFAYTLVAVQEDLDYRVAAGEESSEVYRLSVYAPPELLQVEARCAYPAYTGLADDVQLGGDIRAVVGTRVGLDARFSKPLVKAELRTVRGDTLRGEIDGARAHFRFEVTDTTEYRFRVKDVEGYPDDADEEFTIYALPDEPPVVGFAEPGGDVWTTQADVVEVEVTAEDDFGLRELHFAYAITGQEEQAVDMGSFAAPGERTAGGERRFALRDLELEPGQVITYYAEGADWMEPPQRSSSDIHMIAVRPFQEELAGIGGQCQGACRLLSGRQAALLRQTWRLARSEAPWADQVFQAEELAGEQDRIRADLGRLLAAVKVAVGGDVDLTVVRTEGEKAGGAMERAAARLREVELAQAVPPEQAALSALLRLEMELPKKMGSGGGGGDGDSGEMPADAEVALDEVTREFEEQEMDRQAALFRRARDLLMRARQAHGAQQVLNWGWGAWGRQVAGAGSAEELRTRQEGLRQETAVLAQDVALLERELEEESVASRAAGQAAEQMGQAVGEARQDRFQRASARGTKARVQLERAIDALYPMMARHAGELLPLLAAALEYLAERQEGLAQASAALEKEGVDRENVSALAELMLAQKVLPESASRLRRRLEEAAGELEALAPSMAVRAENAARTMRDSLVEEGTTQVAWLLEEMKLLEAAAEGQRVTALLRYIAAELMREGEEEDSELAQVNQALEATRGMRRAVGQGGGAGAGDGIGGSLKELDRLYEPLDDADLESGLGRLQQLVAAKGTGSGLQEDARVEALDALDGMVEVLEGRLRRLQQLLRLQQLERDGYPPAYRELVYQYYKVLAESGDER